MTKLCHEISHEKRDTLEREREEGEKVKMLEREREREGRFAFFDTTDPH